MVRMFMSILGLLVLTVLPCNAGGRLRILNGTITTEYVNDPLGGTPFIVVYNRILEIRVPSNIVKLNNPESEAECRVQAIVRGSLLCSILTYSNQTVECRISSGTIGSANRIIPMDGAITYIRSAQTEYWPAVDGIFYEPLYQIRKNIDQQCSPSEFRMMPVFKGASSFRMKIFKEFAGKKNVNHLILGATKNGNESTFTWHLNNSIITGLSADIEARDVLGMNATDDFIGLNDYSCYTKMYTVCMYNLFDLPW